MTINGRTIGQGQPAYIIGEISANHNHDKEIAKQTIKMAKEVGLDAVKIQTYTPDTITIDCDRSYFQVNQGTIWDGTTLYKLYETAYTPYEWHEELFAYAKEIGITIFSTPFDHTAVTLLETLQTPAYKIASFEINDIPLLRRVARTKKPIIMSTGVATKADIEEAVNTCKEEGNDDIVLLKCTSAYPTPIEGVNLNTLANMRQCFGLDVGLSDHTLGTLVAVGAVALGACVIEKHIILDKKIGGPDATFSLDRAELTKLVDDVRQIEAALGRVTYELTDQQVKSKEHARSLFVVCDVKKGDRITEQNVRSIRPAFGMHTRHYEEILGKTFNADLEKGTPMAFQYIAGE